jgi:hypothetical protein
LPKAEIKPSYPPVYNTNRFCTIRHLSNSSSFQGSFVPTVNLGPTLGGCLKSLSSRESAYFPHTFSIIQAVVHTLSADQQDIDPYKACLYVSLLLIITRSPEGGFVVLSNGKVHRVFVSS